MTQRHHTSSISRLADFLTAHKENILEHWIEAVEDNPGIPSTYRLTDKQLMDHLPRLLQEIIEQLRQEAGDGLSTQESSTSKTHGRQRWQQGFALDELLFEIDILRQVLLIDYL